MFLKRRIPVWALVLIVIATVSTSYAVVLFTQTFPPVTVPPLMTVRCPNLANMSGAAPIQGTILFACDIGGLRGAAFTVNQPATVTPSFTLPAGYIDLKIVPDGPTCTGATTITSGEPISLTPGNYNYCATYEGIPSNGGNLAGFDITWNQ